MKKTLALIVALVFALGVVSVSFAADAVTLATCQKCHKGDKALDKITAAKNIQTADDLIKTLRSSPKAKMHEKFTDDNLKAVAKELKLK